MRPPPLAPQTAAHAGTAAAASAGRVFSAGNDDIRAGWGGGYVEVHGGSGNDSVSTGGDKRIIAYGDAGIDTLEGGSFPDTLDGGSGNDTAYAHAGDTVKNVEAVWAN